MTTGKDVNDGMGKYEFDCEAIEELKKAYSKPDAPDAPDACDMRFKLMIEAIKQCIEHADGKRGVKGTIECPRCGGVLHYAVVPSNGHMRGKCETDNCLQWIQ